MNDFLHRFTAAVLGVALALTSLASLPVMAGGSGGYVSENIAEIDILPGWRQADGSHIAALRIRLSDGWKTYWRAPGEAGIPPGFDWSGSRNLEGVSFHWPVPTVFDTSGMQTIGYYDELILPIQLYPRREGQKITLKGRVSLGVCSDVCMPMEARFNAVLPASDGVTDGAGLIHSALKNGPYSASQAGLTAISCDVEPISDGLRVTSRLTMPRVGPDEVVVIETGDQAVWVSQAEVRREGGTLIASSDLVPPSGAPFALSRSDIRITVLAAGRGVDITSCVPGS
ncbi:MAG: hypothetical protein GY945_15680 [Rhodobacteraceae bacterium]|nr:hypothetical protein [Paracoccaceae bacterium]